MAPALSSTSWLKGLLQLFESGQNCDIVIRVRLASDDHAAKRSRSMRYGAAAAAGAEEGRSTDIPTHAIIITTRSKYMASCLKKEWKEGQQRMVELTLEDEQALEDLRLLLRLSYTDSYVKDSDTGELLPRPLRLRLAALADALEFTEAVEQVVASLAVGLDFEAALMAFDDLPPALEGHEGMAAVREAVAAKLAEEIQKLDKLRRLQQQQEEEDDDEEHKGEQERAAKLAGLEAKLGQAGDALADCLGPVAAMFCEEKGTTPGWWSDSDDYSTAPLRSIVKELPPSSMEALLKSEKLQLQTESETYGLLCSWLHQFPHVKGSASARVNMYRRLLRHIRFHHFPLHYVGNVLPHCPLLRDSGLYPSVLTSALVQREASTDLLRLGDVAQGPPDRAMASEDGTVWKLRATFPLSSCLPVKSRESCSKVMGIAAGYPFLCDVTRGKNEDGQETFGLYFKPLMPPTIGADASAGATKPSRGVGLRVNVLSPTIDDNVEHFFHGRDCYGWSDFFDKPWAEVVHEGSPHFPDGKLEVVVEVKMVMKG